MKGKNKKRTLKAMEKRLLEVQELPKRIRKSTYYGACLFGWFIGYIGATIFGFIRTSLCFILTLVGGMFLSVVIPALILQKELDELEE